MTSRKIIGLFSVLLGGWMGLAGPAGRAEDLAADYQAGVAGNPDAAPDPAASGWTAGVPTGDTGNFLSAAVSPDGDSGYNAWRLLDNSSASSQYITWNRALTAAQYAASYTNGWTLAARLRVADPNGSNSRRSVAFRYGNGSRSWQVFIGVTNLNATLQLYAAYSSGATMVLPAAAPGDYHEYQLICGPTNTAATFYVDGAVVGTGFTGETGSVSGLQWGTSSGSGKGDGYWNQVGFVIGDPPSGPKPTVVTDPVSQSVDEGGGVILTAAFSGAVTGYQWFKDTAPVAGATTTNLTLAAVTAASAGDYWCRAYNGATSYAGTATAALSVRRPGAELTLAELLAENDTGDRDEDGDQSDWIELYNPSAAAQSTAGWFLTDDAAVPEKWALPAATVPAGGFLRIWASGKDRAVAGGEGHANFALQNGGGYLALVRPDRTAAVALTYPAQYADHSYGFTVHAPGRLKYFLQPTPGALNVDGLTCPQDGIAFDAPPGVFTNTVEVAVSCALSGGTVRYTTDGTRPEFDSAAYTGPLAFSAATRLRAAMVYPGERHGASGTASYLRAGTDVQSFTSPLPIVLLSNFGAGAVPGVSSRGPSGDGSDVVQVDKQPQALMILDAPSGDTTLASAVVQHTRAGLRLRGSSSFSFTVKSYALETWGEFDDQSRAVGLLGLSPENDWVLYGPDASQYDITLIHNTFTYELARQSGFNAPRYRFVDLFVDANGDGQISMSDYKGLSVLLEKPKRDGARVDFDVMSADGAQGGWLLNVDRMDALPPGSAVGSLAPRHFHTAGLNRTLENADDCAHGTANVDMPEYYHSFFNFVSPDGWEINASQRGVIQTTLRAFDAALYGADYTNAVTGYGPHIDAANWAHHLAIHCFTKNQDAVVLSAYLYRETPSAPIRWATIWDFDRAFNKNPTSGVATDRLTWAHDRLYYKRLVTDPEFMQAYIDVWQDLRRGAFATTNLSAIVDAQAAEITSAVAARSGVPASTWATRLAALKTWLQARAAAMDALYVAPPTITPRGGAISAGLFATLSAPSGTVYYTTDGSDPRLRGGAVSPAAGAYSAPLAISQAVTLKARVKSGASWSGLTRATFFWASAGPVFIPGGSADWTADANWESAPSPYPNGNGHAGTIGAPNPDADRNVNLRAPVIVGRLTFPQGTSAVRNRVRDRDAGNTLTFANNGTPARVDVGGSGAGHVEFEVAAGAILADSLELNVTNLVGNAEYGALRLRETWSGPGGIVKQGPGVASLTGSGKAYTGATVIEEGVLQVTESAAPGASSGMSVADGGQLRLISDGAPVYAFGADVVLSGGGRGAAIPDQAGLGKRGALRYDPNVSAPGSENNRATLTNAVVLATDADIHIDHSTNVLDVSGALRGAGTLTKSGGGTLALSGDSPAYAGSLCVENGTLALAAELAAPVDVQAEATLTGHGRAGALTGAGALMLAGTVLRADALNGPQGRLVFTAEGGPDFTRPAAAGNGVLIAESAAPSGLWLYLNTAGAPASGARFRGGLLLPRGGAWQPGLVAAAPVVMMPDAAGTHAFDGRTWSVVTNAHVTRMPVSVDLGAGAEDREILEVRIGGGPVRYDEWRALVFTNAADRANAAVSGPLAKPFGDGVPNLLRYAYGATDGGPLTDRVPRLRRSGGTWFVAFPFDAGRFDLRCRVESTPQANDWSDPGVLFDSAARIGVPDGRGWLEIPDPAPDAERRFYRLRVDQLFE